MIDKDGAARNYILKYPAKGRETMKKKLVFAAATLLIVVPLTAEAMTHAEAMNLYIAAMKGNAASLQQLQQSAKQGSPSAQTWLGVYYVSQNHYHPANHWFRKAADHGDARAENSLGGAYYNGHGVPQNYVTAIYWYRKAADQGLADAEFNLGAVYRYGYGVPQNYVTANYWFRKAADQGFALAEYNLGVDYYKGEGLPQSSTQALYWEKKAAEQDSGMPESVLHALEKDHPD